jgi:hypothetical protein
VPIMPIGVSVNSVRPRGPENGDAAWRTRVEGIESERQTFRARSAITEADLIFKLDAARLGYLDQPRGLSAYYRAFGMLPPRYLAETIPTVEFTNFDLNLLVDRAS